MKENYKSNPYATYEYTVKTEKKAKDAPTSTVRCGTDLRTAGKQK